MDDPQVLYDAADILVATASREPHGRTLAEAMVAGAVPVASASAGHLETVVHRRTGLLVRPGRDEVAQFASYIEGLLNAPTHLKEIRRSAQLSANTKFSPTEHARSIQGVYARLQARRATGGVG